MTSILYGTKPEDTRLGFLVRLVLAALVVCCLGRLGALGERFGRGAPAMIQKDFHLLLGRFQCALALARQRNTALKRLQSIIQRQIALFQARNQRLKLGERTLEIDRGRIRRSILHRFVQGLAGLSGSGHTILDCNIGRSHLIRGARNGSKPLTLPHRTNRVMYIRPSLISTFETLIATFARRPS
jgi:hypothetical protein